jgi:hypothetical protein
MARAKVTAQRRNVGDLPGQPAIGTLAAHALDPMDHCVRGVAPEHHARTSPASHPGECGVPGLGRKRDPPEGHGALRPEVSSIYAAGTVGSARFGRCAAMRVSTVSTS